MTPTDTPSWRTLTRLAGAINEQSSATLTQAWSDPESAPSGSTELPASTLSPVISGCTFDFQRQRITPAILQTLLSLAEDTGTAAKITQMLNGDHINRSEDRAVLHSALRDGTSAPTADAQAVQHTRTRMLEMATAIREGQWSGYTGRAITDVVHIGIGGSHLGPELAVSALKEFSQTHLRIHFVANVDSHDIQAALHGLNPETTLFVIVSKTFSTVETKLNAHTARSWFLERTGSVAGIGRHFLAVTTNAQAAAEFGLPAENLLPLWDWVGGRYSIWSAVGVTLAISIGADAYQHFLGGAQAVDQHLANALPVANVPLLSALLSIWNYNFLGAQSHAILCYDSRLAMLPDYLQQLEMESNGKSVTQNGEAVTWHTMPILWGGVGTLGQHAYHQLLHQGTRAFTADIILTANTASAHTEHQRWLQANGLAQAQALANGYAPPADAPHRKVAGNHPTTTVILPELNPHTLGVLLACYEHKVLCAGHIWNINSFDQWGVELGKNLARPIFQRLSGNPAGAEIDAVTLKQVDTLLSKTS